MNSLIKKVIPVILVLLLITFVFSGCGAAPETTEPEAAKPDAEATPGISSLIGKVKDFLPRLLEFFDWWTTQVNNFFALIEAV